MFVTVVTLLTLNSALRYIRSIRLWKSIPIKSRKYVNIKKILTTLYRQHYQGDLWEQRCHSYKFRDPVDSSEPRRLHSLVNSILKWWIVLIFKNMYDFQLILFAVLRYVYVVLEVLNSDSRSWDYAWDYD